MERKHDQVKMYGAFTLTMKGYFSFLFYMFLRTDLYICSPASVKCPYLFLVALSRRIYII